MNDLKFIFDKEKRNFQQNNPQIVSQNMNKPSKTNKNQSSQKLQCQNFEKSQKIDDIIVDELNKNQQSFDKQKGEAETNKQNNQNINNNEENNFDQETKLQARFCIDLKILFDKNLTVTEKKERILKDIKDKLTIYFKELNIDQKIENLKNRKNKKNLETVLKQRSIISKILEQQFIDKKDNTRDNITENKQEKFEEQIKKMEWGKIRITNKQKCYQGDVRNQQMWDYIIEKQKEINKDLMFTGIIMDPPWNDTALPLKYDLMENSEWMDSIPLDKLQKVGYLFLWITNAQLENAIEYFEKFNYERVDAVVWVKLTEDDTVADGIGFYLRHSFEMCFVAQKQENLELLKFLHKTHTAQSVILEERKHQSEKPTEIYEIMETLMPNGYYLDIFGRKYNQRDNWVTVGNESIDIKIQPEKKMKKKKDQLKQNDQDQ